MCLRNCRVGLVVLVLSAILLSPPFFLTAQQSVNQADGPPSGPAMQSVYIYSGTAVIAICWSPSAPVTQIGSSIARITRNISITAATNASAAALTVTTHGFSLSSLPSITIKGATGNWAPINGTFIATPTDANTFTIPVDSTSFGALTGTVTFITTAPRTTIAEWAVQIFKYTGSQVNFKGWLGGAQGFNQTCPTAGYPTTTVVQ